MICGENGDNKYSINGLGNKMLAFFDKLVRGLSEQKIRSFVHEIVVEARKQKDIEKVKNLFLMAFQTRWCRGGKGERKIFYVFLKILHETFPVVVLRLLELIPNFGYWKDLLCVLEECRNEGTSYDDLKNRVFGIFANQLMLDKEELENARKEDRTPRISLCAKYCPSEGGHYSRTISADKEICKFLFPHIIGSNIATSDTSWHHARAKYRRLISALRKALDIPEILMCGNRWAEIRFEKVSSLCIDRHKHAFLNETKKTANPDRVVCREQLLKHIVEKGLNGKQLFPHELVKQALNSRNSEAVSMVLNVQWDSLRAGLLDMVEERKKQCEYISNAYDNSSTQQGTDLSKKTVDFSRIVPMSDVSGSMAGTPILVSIALGILVSEVTLSTFKNKVLTFDDTPTWHDLSDASTFVEKVQSLADAPWGGSTDFYIAMECIADLVRRDRLQQDQIPDLLVVSDMEFNTIHTENFFDHGQGETHRNYHWDHVYSRITTLFYHLGIEMYGSPIIPPTIIFWNVRSDNIGYPVSSDQKGVLLLSGFSPALMKFILSGELQQDVISDLDLRTENNNIDPSDMLLRVLNDDGLDPIRKVLHSMQEHIF